MSAIEIRKLARVVIDAGGDLDDLKALAARWGAARVDRAAPRPEPIRVPLLSRESFGDPEAEPGSSARLAYLRARREQHERELEADARTLADLADAELLAVFPGAAVEHGPELESEDAPCGCRHRTRGWRLRGEAVDVTTTYASNGALTEAQGRGRDVIPKDKRSGWIVETTPTGHGHPWTCAPCHSPADGLDVETREGELALDPVTHPSPLEAVRSGKPCPLHPEAGRWRFAKSDFWMCVDCYPTTAGPPRVVIEPDRFGGER